MYLLNLQLQKTNLRKCPPFLKLRHGGCADKTSAAKTNRVALYHFFAEVFWHYNIYWEIKTSCTSENSLFLLCKVLRLHSWDGRCRVSDAVFFSEPKISDSAKIWRENLAATNWTSTANFKFGNFRPVWLNRNDLWSLRRLQHNSVTLFKLSRCSVQPDTMDFKQRNDRVVQEIMKASLSILNFRAPL